MLPAGVSSCPRPQPFYFSSSVESSGMFLFAALESPRPLRLSDRPGCLQTGPCHSSSLPAFFGWVTPTHPPLPRRPLGVTSWGAVSLTGSDPPDRCSQNVLCFPPQHLAHMQSCAEFLVYTLSPSGRMHHLDGVLAGIIFCFVPSMENTQCLAQSRSSLLKNYRRCVLDWTSELGSGWSRTQGFCLPNTL